MKCPHSHNHKQEKGGKQNKNINKPKKINKNTSSLQTEPAEVFSDSQGVDFILRTFL